jgi:hypothetical protein
LLHDLKSFAANLVLEIFGEKGWPQRVFYTEIELFDANQSPSDGTP